MSRKIIILTIIIILIFAVLIGIGIYFLSNSQSNNNIKEQPFFEHYIDVSINELSPQYDNKRVCLYGDYSSGFEHQGFYSDKDNSVWVYPSIIEIFDSFSYFIVSPKSKTDIACGAIQYFPKGTGHLGSYKYQLFTDIMVESKDEFPYLERVNVLDDCQKISGIYRRNICYYDFAVKNKNDKICDSINNEKIKSFCLSSIGYKLSNSRSCEKIGAAIRKENYETIYFPIKVFNPGIIFLKEDYLSTDFLKGENILIRDFCYAVSTLQYKECSQITDSQLKIDCLKRVAFQSNNPKICSKIESSTITDKMFCYGDLVIKLDNLDICEKLPQGVITKPDGSGGRYISEKSDCYAAVTARTGDYQICDRLNDEDEKNRCLMFKN